MKSLTKEQIILCASLLSKLEPGFLPLEIFTEISKIVRLPTVVVIPVRLEGGRVEVGLLKRSLDDNWWPNMWDVPGTVFKATDTMNSCTQRLLDNEICIEKSDPPIFRNFLTSGQNKRGSEVNFIYSVENCKMKDNSPIKWFLIGNLPSDFIVTNKDFIVEIQKSFLIKIN